MSDDQVQEQYKQKYDEYIKEHTNQNGKLDKKGERGVETDKKIQGPPVNVPGMKAWMGMTDAIEKMQEAGGGWFGRGRFDHNQEPFASIAKDLQYHLKMGKEAGILSDRQHGWLDHLNNTMTPEGSRSPPPHFAKPIRDAFPESQPAQVNYARSLNDFGDPAGAARESQAAINMGPKRPEPYLSLASALDNMGDVKGAYKAGLEALRLDPYNREAEAWVRSYKGRAERAGETAAPSAGTGGSAPADFRQSAQPYDPAGAAATRRLAPSEGTRENARLAYAAAATLFKDRNYPAAQRNAANAASWDPKNKNAHMVSIQSLIAMHEYEKAAQAADKALDLFAGDKDIRRLKSVALTYDARDHNRKGLYQDALALTLRAIEADPQLAAAHYEQGVAYAGIGGHRAEAGAAFEKAKRIDERFAAEYERWLNSTEEEFLAGLGGGKPSGSAKGRWWPDFKGRGAMTLGLAVIVGAFLVAMGLLQNVGENWGEAFRRLLAKLTRRSPRVRELPDVPADPRPAPRPLLGRAGGSPGMLSGSYRIDRQIGSGGMGVVYAGLDTALERRVAIKKMRDEIRADPRERERFLKEARLVAALHHPNIVEIYSIIEDGSDAYLIFEFVDGSTVNDLLFQRKRILFPEAVGVMRGACDALDYAHKRDVIHRDLKPSNIMINREREVKVMDFGVARLAKDSLTRLSMTDTVVGTPPYMAPEQEQGMVRKASDVYALAVLLYEMVTGKLPFAGVGAGMLMAKINKTYIPAGRLAELPRGFDDIMARALEPDPNHRWPTAGEFVRALESLAVPR